MSKKETFLHARKRGQSIVENSLIDDNQLSMQAKYLLIQFCSHRQGEWKINMKDIVNRSKNGRDAHYTALKELIHNEYVARIKVVEKGMHREQIYVFGQIKEDVKEMMEEVVKTNTTGDFTCRLEFGEPLTENLNVDSKENSDASEQPFTEKPNVGEWDSESQYNINNQETNNQETNNNTYNNINNDDDKRVSDSPKISEEINNIINLLREASKEDISNRSFKSVVNKVLDKYRQGKVGNFRDYLATSLANKIEQLELRRIKENAKSALKGSAVRNSEQIHKHYMQQIDQIESNSESIKVPFYNWLDE